MARPVHTKDRVGQRFGRWTVTGRDATRADTRNVYWLCRCDCGTIKSVHHGSLVSGSSTSCGCYREEVKGRQNYKHGQSNSPEWKCWRSMRRRCSEPKRIYHHGRGIRVCERWQVFENFLADMGPRPSPAHTLERVRNDGDYEPGNVVWATASVQAQNKRSTHLVTYQGRTLSMNEWSRALGFPVHTVKQRIGAGWSIERTLTTPVPSHEHRRRPVSSS